MSKHSFLVAQLGARRHYAIPQMLQSAGLLEHFYTDICAVKGWPRLLGVVPSKFRPAGLRRLLGRVPYGVPSEKISALTSLGWSYVRAKSNAESGEESTSVSIDFGEKLCEAILEKGFGQATATYTFNSAGLELMRAAKQAGLKTVMEQVSAPRAVELEILSEAANQYPSWSEGIPSGPNTDAFVAREEEEWQYADLIICGSEFVLDGIAKRGGPVDRCRIVPTGCDNRYHIERGYRQPGPLRVLTIGYVNMQKGTPVVWDAARMIGLQAEFRMVGRVSLLPGILEQKPANVTLFGPVPRKEITEQYRWADVFLLPSFSEGSATVTYEAMLAGLPVICTPNTGSLVLDGISGRIVPPFSAEAVAAALQKWIEDPEFLDNCHDGAIKQAPQLGLDAYRQRLLTQLNTL